MSMRSPIFVVASPGSGVAVLFEVLDRARETTRLRDKDVTRLRKVSLGTVVSPEQAKELRSIYRDAARGSQRVVVSDLARHGLSIATAHAVWPEARFVYLYRDASGHIAAAQPTFGTSVETWQAATSGMLDALVALPAASWCAVNYVDLLNDPDSEAQWLGHMLGLTWTSAHPAGGTVLHRHRAAAALRDGFASADVLPDDLIELAQRAEALQQRHHPAWVAGDLAKARQGGSSRGTLERFQRAVVSSRVAAGVCLATALPQAARAATYTVTNTNDTGAGSLRAAVTSVNGDSTPDTITFSGVTGTVKLTSGPLKITNSVTIQGPGSSSLAIDGNNSSCVFYPYSKTNLIDVTISNLTVQNANNPNNGGAISAVNTNLSLEDCVVQNSASSKSGGGVAVLNTALNSNVNIVNSTIQNNTAKLPGGGVYLAAAGNTTFTVTGSNILKNIAHGDGAGIEVSSTKGNAIGVIENTAVLDNNSTAGTGAGVRFNSNKTLLVQNCNISGNAASGSTGGLYSSNSNTVIDTSTFMNNTGTEGAAIQVWSGPMTITHSTVADNNSTGPCGGIWFDYAAKVIDCTITGNTGTKGAGLLGGNGNTVIEGSTISGNKAANGRGGGFYLYGTSSVGPVIHNSIIAGNTSTTGRTQLDGNPNAVFTISFSLVSDANDLVDHVAGDSNLVFVQSNNIVGQNPNLGSLGNHGGQTPTLMPADNSPVINAGDPNVTGLPSTDERGLTRVVQGRVDMGAVELQLCSNSNNLEGEGGCPIGGTTGGTTTGGTTTGGGHGGGGGGCATTPNVNNTFAGVGFLAAAMGFLRRRRRK